MHVLTKVAPVAVEYVPAPQLLQSADPVISLYFPATHATHGPPPAPVNPELQTQLLANALPLGDCESAAHGAHTLASVAPTASECVLAGHSVHGAEPGVVLYLPSAHSVHVPPSGPMNPGLHTQLVCAVDPTTD